MAQTDTGASILYQTGTLLLGGLGASIYAVEFWGRSAFADLDPTVSMRIVLPGVTALILGLQVIFSSFFFSVLELSRRYCGGSIPCRTVFFLAGPLNLFPLPDHDR